MVVNFFLVLFINILVTYIAFNIFKGTIAQIKQTTILAIPGGAGEEQKNNKAKSFEDKKPRPSSPDALDSNAMGMQYNPMMGYGLPFNGLHYQDGQIQNNKVEGDITQKGSVSNEVKKSTINIKEAIIKIPEKESKVNMKAETSNMTLKGDVKKLATSSGSNINTEKLKIRGFVSGKIMANKYVRANNSTIKKIGSTAASLGRNAINAATIPIYKGASMFRNGIINGAQGGTRELRKISNIVYTGIKTKFSAPKERLQKLLENKFHILDEGQIDNLTDKGINVDNLNYSPNNTNIFIGDKYTQTTNINSSETQSMNIGENPASISTRIGELPALANSNIDQIPVQSGTNIGQILEQAGINMGEIPTSVRAKIEQVNSNIIMERFAAGNIGFNSNIASTVDFSKYLPNGKNDIWLTTSEEIKKRAPELSPEQVGFATGMVVASIRTSEKKNEERAKTEEIINTRNQIFEKFEEEHPETYNRLVNIAESMVYISKERMAEIEEEAIYNVSKRMQEEHLEEHTLNSKSNDVEDSEKIETVEAVRRVIESNSKYEQIKENNEKNQESKKHNKKAFISPESNIRKNIGLDNRDKTLNGNIEENKMVSFSDKVSSTNVNTGLAKNEAEEAEYRKRAELAIREEREKLVEIENGKTTENEKEILIQVEKEKLIEEEKEKQVKEKVEFVKEELLSYFDMDNPDSITPEKLEIVKTALGEDGVKQLLEILKKQKELNSTKEQNTKKKKNKKARSFEEIMKEKFQYRQQWENYINGAIGQIAEQGNEMSVLGKIYTNRHMTEQIAEGSKNMDSND